MTVEEFIKTNVPEYKSKDVVIPFPVELRTLGPNSIVTNYGEIENKMCLLVSGVVQINALRGDDERVLEFAFPGSFFGAYTSYLLQEPSDVQVVTLNESKAFVFTRENLLQDFEMSMQLRLHIAEQLFLSRARREKDFLTLSAEQRYKKLLEHNKDVVRLIPGIKIAKYLGIQPESLSRIRKAIIS